MFYELEFRDDNIEGLNQNEFKQFKARLDEETAKKFRTFKELDVDGNGTIDIDEFQKELNRIFNTLNTKLGGYKRKKKKGDTGSSNEKKIDQWTAWLR